MRLRPQGSQSAATSSLISGRDSVKRPRMKHDTMRIMGWRHAVHSPYAGVTQSTHPALASCGPFTLRWRHAVHSPCAGSTRSTNSARPSGRPLTLLAMRIKHCWRPTRKKRDQIDLESSQNFSCACCKLSYTNGSF
jgi:hypothetical protein